MKKTPPEFPVVSAATLCHGWTPSYLTMHVVLRLINIGVITL